MRCSIFILFFAIPLAAFSQRNYNLQDLLLKKKLRVYNREASVSENAGEKAVKLSAAPGDGVAWLENLFFSEGTIEIDLKGKDEFQKSFLGIAFHGQNDSTYDAVYFRPFNFRTTDSVRHIHAVQYISHPKYTWKKLREEQNAQYEKVIAPAPDPIKWFHARIVVKNGGVSVYVNNAKEPSLEVKKLNNNSKGAIGLWVGDGADGSFANLSVTPK